MAIAKGKQGEIRAVLKYDVKSYSYLMTDTFTKNQKSRKWSTTENHSTRKTDLSRKVSLNANGLVAIGFMSFVRSQVVPDINADEKTPNFGKFLIIYSLELSLLIVTSQSTKLHVVFGSWRNRWDRLC